MIGFVGFDGVTTLDLTGPLEAFAAARSDMGDVCYETVVIAAAGETFVAGSGAMFKAQHTLVSAPALDTIIIPGAAATLPETSTAIARWLRDRAQTTRRIVAVSGGIYPLAESGLLEGRRVTTHWRYAQHVAATFRGVHVNNTSSFVKDGKFYTCGGGTAGIEMSLALIKEDFGAQTALRLARELVVSLRPAGSGDDRQLDPFAESRGAEDRLEELPAWITSRLRSNLSVEVLAERACLCPRHFSRIFKRKYNVTPAEFVEHLRMTEAARRLAARSTTVEEVANSVGYKTSDVFRRAFERRYGMAPKKFQKLSREQPPKRGRQIRRRALRKNEVRG